MLFCIKRSSLFSDSFEMAATNIFYRIPSQRGTRVATISGTECTLEQFCQYIIDSEGLSRNDFIIANGTKVFRPSSCSLQNYNLQNNSNLDILIPLLGGKGGFGSLLRAIGAQIEKTTNRGACRDLSGRRLRDVKKEDELRKLIALQDRLLEEKQKKKQEKLEKLRKNVETSCASKSIQELVNMFDDHEYNRRRHELADIIEAAIEKGLINSTKKRHQEEMSESNVTQNRDKRARLDMESSEEELTGVKEAKADQAKLANSYSKSQATDLKSKKSVKKENLWLGLDEIDDQESLGESDESDEIEEEKMNDLVTRRQQS